MLSGCIESLRSQVDKIAVINTRPDGQRVWSENDEQVVEVPCYVSPTNPPNISYWWNLGIDVVEAFVTDHQWNILVVNDDVIAPPHLVERLNLEMRNTTAVLASPHMYRPSRYYFHDETSPMTLMNRIAGYTFMLRGEHGIRVDESMAWWWSDTDLEMRARREGGVVIVPNCQVKHLDPNGFTQRDPNLGRQALIDRDTFIRKWGNAPW